MHSQCPSSFSSTGNRNRFLKEKIYSYDNNIAKSQSECDALHGTAILDSKCIEKYWHLQLVHVHET